MHRVAAGNFIVNITFGWEHAVAITDKNDAGKLVSHRFPQFSFAEGMVPEFFRYVIVDEKFRHHLWLASPGGAGRNRVLKLDEMLNYLMRFPSRDEQIKIAEFFRHLDNLITLHQRKCANLCSPSQVVFSLLFATSTFSWEQRKFGEITSKYEDPVPTPHDGYYRLGIRSHAKGTFHSYVAKGQELETAQMHRVAAGNFIVNITFGWEHAVAITDKNDAGKLVSHRFPQFSFAEGMVPEFFRYVIVDEKFRHHLWLASPGGAGRNRVLKLDEMLNYLMRFPSRDEQIKIAEFFRHLDNLITLHQRQSFSHSTPDISLSVQLIHPFYTSSWEQRKVQGVADRFDNLRIPVAANLRVHGTTPYYGANGIQDYVEGFTHDGEFVLVAEDGANDLKNYPVKCVNGRIWVNNHAHVLQGKAGIADNSFLAFAISQSDIESLLVGGGRAKLNAETLMSIEFRLPCLQEQYRIGEYLTQLNHLITLHQRKGKAAVSGCSNDANNSKGVCCKARDFGYKCHKKDESK